MEELFNISVSKKQFYPSDDLNSNPLSCVMSPDDDVHGGVFSHKDLSLFDSGFDAGHPMPTYDQLRNVGFSDYLAHNITSGLSHSYSEKELYHWFYESADPLKSYNDMMVAKVYDSIAKTDKLINDIEAELVL